MIVRNTILPVWVGKNLLQSSTIVCVSYFNLQKGIGDNVEKDNEKGAVPCGGSGCHVCIWHAFHS